MKYIYKAEIQLTLVAKSSECCTSQIEYFHVFNYKYSMFQFLTDIYKSNGWV